MTDAESVELRWVPIDEVADLPLLPAFADAWPRLRDRLVGPRRPVTGLTAPAAGPSRARAARRE